MQVPSLNVLLLQISHEGKRRFQSTTVACTSSCCCGSERPANERAMVRTESSSRVKMK
jgi:hypothetical protein